MAVWWALNRARKEEASYSTNSMTVTSIVSSKKVESGVPATAAISVKAESVRHTMVTATVSTVYNSASKSLHGLHKTSQHMDLPSCTCWVRVRARAGS